MACPICNSPEGAAINDGLRAGAAVLMVVTVAVIGVIARYAYRIWATERASFDAVENP
jgi:hypothetical protein